MYAYLNIRKEVCRIKALLYADQQRYFEDEDSSFLRIFSNWHLAKQHRVRPKNVSVETSSEHV